MVPIGDSADWDSDEVVVSPVGGEEREDVPNVIDAGKARNTAFVDVEKQHRLPRSRLVDLNVAIAATPIQWRIEVMEPSKPECPSEEQPVEEAKNSACLGQFLVIFEFHHLPHVVPLAQVFD